MNYLISLQNFLAAYGHTDAHFERLVARLEEEIQREKSRQLPATKNPYLKNLMRTREKFVGRYRDILKLPKHEQFVYIYYRFVAHFSLDVKIAIMRNQ